MKYDFDLDLKHNNSLLLILEQVKPKSVVLEFGPANGRLTRYLKEELGCEVYLVEIDAEAGKEALKYGKDIVIGDIEDYQWMEKYREIKFDYLIFADVLEHLRDPQNVLLQSKLLLKESGSVLLSVPNLGHNSVIIDLLNDKFNYSEVGLLDNTHIHFFTKESLETMLREVGLFPCKKMSANVSVGKNEFVNTTESVQGIDKSFWNMRKYGEVYQYIYEVKKDLSFVDEVKNDIIFNSCRNYLQIYAGNGGFDEEHSCKMTIDDGENASQAFSQTFRNDMDMMRIDPSNSSCIIRVRDIKAFYNEKEVEIKLESHNARLCVGDLYVFLTEDPNITYKTIDGEKLNRVNVLIEYITIDESQIKKCAGSILEIVENQLSESESKNNNYETQLKELESRYNESIELEKELKKVLQEFECDDLKEIEDKYSACIDEMSELEDELKELKKQNEALLDKANKLEKERDNLTAQVCYANELVNAKDKLLQSIFDSKSWKVTKIFRHS